MEFRDLIVTPIVIMVVFTTAILLKPFVTDRLTGRYFYPALILKIAGAIFLGVIYQFYYTGGDTYNYHTYGSRLLWEALIDDFPVGVELFFSDGEIVKGGYKYFEPMPFYGDAPSYTIIQIATLLDLFTFSTYSATAVLFSVISFVGGWAMFQTFYSKWPHLHFRLALATLFIPSVIFWGSGILKDTIVLAVLGISVFCIDRIFIKKKFTALNVVSLLISLYTVFVIRRFMLEVLIPSTVLWIYFKNLSAINSAALKIVIAPFIILIFLVTAYFSVIKVSEGDQKYSVEKLAQTAQITAYDIRYGWGRDAGSGYTLGELDGSFASMLRLSPAAVNVAFFRPYLWEVKNPLMLLSALESFVFLMLTVYVILRGNIRIFSSLTPDIVFCLAFSVAVAFAVGISTFNFGTLARYKIPMQPFFAVAMVLIVDNLSNKKNYETRVLN